MADKVVAKHETRLEVFNRHLIEVDKKLKEKETPELLKQKDHIEKEIDLIESQEAEDKRGADEIKRRQTSEFNHTSQNLASKPGIEEVVVLTIDDKKKVGDPTRVVKEVVKKVIPAHSDSHDRNNTVPGIGHGKLPKYQPNV